MGAEPLSDMDDMLRMITLEQIPAGDYSVLERFWAVMDSLPLVPRSLLADEGRRCRAMEYRAHDERHGCALCPDVARAVLIAGPSDLIGAARWLDVCPSCYGDLRKAGSCGLTDAEILALHWRWESAR